LMSEAAVVTLSTRSPLADPIVEYERRATTGSASRNTLHDSAAVFFRK
jgi:hypothetical protein